ncbi:putative S-adenosylmethionine-dependent methyltransferase/MSMEI_2290 [Thermoflexales bacterium]|nr:putative S-adenosylmethionine-dependent methyltransferase/MSMEI_2290 [Thermoflexales bacterium]
MSQKPNHRVEDLEKAARRGEPSHVWRFGQNRRLEMIVSRLPSDTWRILVDGCGVGQYVRHLAALGYNTIGLDIDFDRVRDGRLGGIEQLHAAAGEQLPYPDNTFDALLSHEVIEHVADDRQAAREMIRVLRPGGRVILFCPNRWYPFETHGHYWRGKYHFGNTPLINYLPNLLRNRLAPHVRAYTSSGIRNLFEGLPVRILQHTQIYPGYDNLVKRRPAVGKMLRTTTYAFERTPLKKLGLSHFLVVEKLPGP